uniref:Interleukin 17D n=1 Tax=Peromyscus maniculatus bairdii TaxID=230844 RepID=A0A8C8U4P1_PERMB
RNPLPLSQSRPPDSIPAAPLVGAETSRPVTSSSSSSSSSSQADRASPLLWGRHPARRPHAPRVPADRRFRPPTNLRSVSPWAYRISYDPARFPRYLPEAYCLCRGCLTGLFGEEDFRFRSAPVYSPAVVLRRTAACAGGRSVYAEHYVTIPVGCTCVPEPDKASDNANSSMDKPGAKLLLGPSDRPAGR